MTAAELVVHAERNMQCYACGADVDTLYPVHAGEGLRYCCENCCERVYGCEPGHAYDGLPMPQPVKVRRELPLDAHQVIQAYALERAIDEYPDKPNGDLWRASGAILDGGAERFVQFLSDALEEDEDASDWPLRVVWRSTVEMATVSFVEGDVLVFLAHHAQGWQAHLRNEREFYAKYV